MNMLYEKTYATYLQGIDLFLFSHNSLSYITSHTDYFFS